jgi:hypothetical protein
MNGLKSLARELPQYGRYNDDMVAHISSDEARLLKSLGGSGTINPVTGLPEFGFGSFVRSITQPVQRAVGQLNPLNPGSAVSKAVDSIPIVGDINRAANNLGTQIFQPLEKAIVQPASRGLAQFDKAVGNTIPGGWGTVASVAGSAMGLPTPFLVGLGALNGSGVTRKGGSFNLQGAMMGGAMAYGAAELGDYMRGAVPPGGESGFNALPVSEVPKDGISSLYNSTGGFADPSAIPSSAINSANAATAAAQNINPATGLQYGSMLGDTLSGTVPPTPPSIHYGTPLVLHPQTYQSSFGWFLGWNALGLLIYMPRGRYCFFGWWQSSVLPHNWSFSWLALTPPQFSPSAYLCSL